MAQIKRNTAKLTLFNLVMMTIVSVDSIRNLPATALFGSKLIFFYCAAALFFLLPTAIVSAQLSALLPEHSGIYSWIKSAFGQRLGFLAVWLQWMENVIWYPTILSFVAGSIGYLIAPDIASHPWFLVITILIIFWGATLINLLGIKTSAQFSNLCSIFGLLVPMALIITLGTIWILQGKPLAISFNLHEMLPNLHQANTWVALTGVALSFCGMELATVHAKDVDNPQRTFPIALMYASAIILSTLLFGGLAIAIVLPSNNINLVTGIMQAFDAFFKVYHLHWVLPIAAIMLVLGGIGSVNNWIISPVRGLLIAAKDGCMSQHFHDQNSAGAPRKLLIYQASLVTILASIFLFLPTVNDSYWLLTVLAAQLYMIMYVMMFVACIVLSKRITRQPANQQFFRIPGGQYGVWIVCLFGIIGSLATFFISFVQPEMVSQISSSTYVSSLIAALILLCAIPFALHRHAAKNTS